MKKLASLVFSLAMTLPAHAGENWVSVLDSTDGARLLVDSDSFNPAKSDDEKIIIGAMFKFVSEGEPGPVFVYITEASSCNQNGGPLLYRAWENNAWVTKKKFWWSVNGSKMFDGAGRVLCDILNVRIKESSSKKTPDQKIY